MSWLFLRSVRRAPRRLLLAAIGVAFPVATLAATLMFIDHAVHSMTPAALRPVQVEMRAIATSLNVDMDAAGRKLAAVDGVRRVQRFATANVVVSAPGIPTQVPARLFAVDPEYLQHHAWVTAAGARLDGGALLTEPLRATGGFTSATSLSLSAPGDPAAENPPPAIGLRVGGTVDLRHARTWWEIPMGPMQGDAAVAPRALLIDYATFERSVLPALRNAAGAGAAAQTFDPGATELPPVSIEAHVAVAHELYPSDPARAVKWSATLRRVLERQSPGAVVVADNAADALLLAREDATNAKILFLLLGIPGALVAAGLGLAAASALAEAQRREDALLRLRGATTGQLAAVTAMHAVVAGVFGSALGLVVAAAGVGAITGRQLWRDVPPDRLAVSVGLAVGAGALLTAVRLVALIRASRRPDVAVSRRLLEAGWAPQWRRARLDLIAIGVGAAILAVNVLTGGLRQTLVEGTTLALAFYVLLAPIAIWFGATLLAIRVLLGLLIRRTRPERARPLSSWNGAALRWLGRRPARTGVAVVLGALAVAFGTNVVTFAATYQAAKQADVKAAFGADLRLTPATEPPPAPPPPGAGVAATSPVRHVSVRLGSDRKTAQVIDLVSYRQAATVAPRMVAGEGVEALVRNPKGVLVAKEIAAEFELGLGDPLTMTIFPDEQNRTRNITLPVAGIYRSFPPDEPLAEIVVTTAVVPAPLPAPDFYLARAAAGHPPAQVADNLRGQTKAFTVGTITDLVIRERRSLTALDLSGLGRLESVAAASVAAVGVAVLGAFLVLERRRESAILRAVGATTRQVLTGPAVEGTVAVLGSLAIGVPIGIGLSMLAIRVLGLFFVLPPPLVVLPTDALVGLAALMIAASGLAMGIALRAVARQSAASVLREP